MSDPVAAPPAGPNFRRITVAGLALLAFLTAALALAPVWGARLQSAWFDVCHVLWPRTLTSTPATVVEIDEASLARLGQWPWPRTLLADLIRAIGRHEPAAIGLDILMPEPDRLSPERLLAAAKASDPILAQRLAALASHDSELARAIGAERVVLGLAGTLERTDVVPRAPPVVVVDRGRDAASPQNAARVPTYGGVLANLDLLEQAARGHGVISAAPSDDVIRHVPLVVRMADRIVPAFAIEMLRVALGVPDIRLHTRGPSVAAIGVGDLVVPTEADGSLRLHYTSRDARRRVSAIDVLEGRVDPVRLQRKLVLVGTTGLGLVDYQLTPLRDRMPGSEIHAQLIENVFDQSWLTRPSWGGAFEVALFVLLGLALIAATPRLRPGAAALVAAACIALPVLASLGAFVAWRLVLDAALPALALFLLFSALLVLTLADAARVRKALERDNQRQREHAAYVAGELQAAKRVQLGFLPRRDAIADPRVEIAATMQPARIVGGDLYDFFLLDANRLFFLVGDVAGKGLSASLFMAVGKALYKTITLRSPQAPVGALMRIANDEVSRDNPEQFFVTAFAGVLDLATGELAYCNAGHENPFLLGERGVSEMRLAAGAGPPLCAVDAFAYEGAHVRLAPGDALCVVTDGVIDAQDTRRTRYGSERVQTLLRRVAAEPADAQRFVDALCADVAAFAAGTEPVDDLTVLAVRWRGPRADAG